MRKGNRMSMSPKSQASAAKALFAALCLVGGMHSAAAQTSTELPSQGKVVALSPNACAQVSDGDQLVFDWNPGFQHAGAVSGINKALLVFAKPGEPEKSITLVSMQFEPAERSHHPRIETLENGIYRLHFTLNLAQVEPGAYRLASARGDARTLSGYQGAAPAVTNDPTRYPYCIEVVSKTSLASSQ